MWGNKRILALTVAAGLLTGCGGEQIAWRWPGENKSQEGSTAGDLGGAASTAANRPDPGEEPSAAGTEGKPVEGGVGGEEPAQAQHGVESVTTSEDSRAERLQLPKSPEELRKGEVVASDVVILNKEPLTVEDVIEPVLPYLQAVAAKRTSAEYERVRFRVIGSEIRNQMDSILLYQEYGPRVTEEEGKHYAKYAARRIKDRINEEFGGRQVRYEKYLEELGLSLEEIKEKRKRELVVVKNLQDSFRPLVRPPRRKELKAFYDSHRAEFHTPPKVEFHAVEAAFADFAKDLAKGGAKQGGQAAGKAARAAALEHIQQAKAEIDAGMPFEAVAKKYSSGVFRHKNGFWGTISSPIPLERLKKASAVVFTLQTGQVSDIIEGPEGFFLVRCGKRIEGRNTSFEQAQQVLRRRFEGIQFDQLIRRKKIELRRKADVRGNPTGLLAKALERLDSLVVVGSGEAR